MMILYGVVSPELIMFGKETNRACDAEWVQVTNTK